MVKCKTTRNLHDKVREKVEKKVLSSGFGRGTIQYQSVVSCSVYLTDAANFLREQTLERLDETIIYSFHVGQSFFDTIKAENCTIACQASENSLQSRKNIFPLSQDAEGDGMKSWVGVFQIFCAKSHTALSAALCSYIHLMYQF